MDNLRVGGVPEHFNVPWHQGIEKQLFAESNINLTWHTFHGGTGEMTQSLASNETDVCVLLTEGITSSIIKGNEARIIGKYISSPLIWGIFSGANNALSSHAEIYDKRYAISRFGSGSHLMPQVDAFTNEKAIKEEQYVVIKNLDGALASLVAEETDVFYWEKYTTLPYVQSGKLKYIGEFLTPWPSFVLAASPKALSEKRAALRNMMDVIYFLNQRIMLNPNALKVIGERHPNIKKEELSSWYHSTEWATHNYINPKMLENVVHTLNRVGIVDELVPVEKLYFRL